MDDLERRRELGNFVRTRRERVTPKEAGLPVSGSRRTLGLRREEVAYLAPVSVTWYTWLEQGRDITVSSQVLNTVARALRMNPTERAHLVMLARQPLVPALPAADKMPPPLQHVLDSLNPNPAYLTGRRWNLLGWNAAALEIFGGFDPDPVHGRNLLWLCFTNPEWRRRIVDWEVHAQCILALFRVSYGMYTGDNACSQLVRDLQQTNAEFARWWSRHDVRDQPGGRKEFWHPAAGRLILEDSMFNVVSGIPDLRLFLYTPLEEEDTPAKLRKLSARIRERGKSLQSPQGS
jgi:hypothetical protein